MAATIQVWFLVWSMFARESITCGVWACKAYVIARSYGCLGCLLCLGCLILFGCVGCLGCQGCVGCLGVVYMQCEMCCALCNCVCVCVCERVFISNLAKAQIPIAILALTIQRDSNWNIFERFTSQSFICHSNFGI